MGGLNWIAALRFRRRRFAVAAVMVAALSPLATFQPAPGQAAESVTGAVVVMYHRFGDDRFPSTNIRLEQFEAHIKELTSGAYKVLPIPEIADAVRQGKPLPDRTVGISIDDAYLSIYTEAWPRLKKAGLPFTLFVATGPIDQKVRGFMTWDQIKEMAAAGVTIGGHTVSHLHMPDADAAHNKDELDRSNRRLEEMLGKRPVVFAYPYGESSLQIQKLMKDAGYIVAFGQHSGVIGSDGNLFDLPRFAMNETYGDMARFKLAVNALPLPVTDVTPADPLIGRVNPPAMGFTLRPGTAGTSQISCFSSHDGRAKLERLGERRIEIRVGRPFPAGRTRINCTFRSGDGRWHWFGRQFYKPE
jgi:peptidoglycan/xylan/chitin deacetylase (PgdA/CDA1 family)